MKNIVLRLFGSVAVLLAAQSFGAVLIPPSDISPVQSGVVLGRTSPGSGRAEQLTAGAGITIANGQITNNGGGGGGAPNDARYITQIPNGTLTNEQPLSILSSGILFSTTATGVITSTGTAASGNALISGGSGAIPTWGKIGLATHVSGNLPVANLNGGTAAGGTTFWRGDGTWAVPSSGGSGTVTVSGTPTSGQFAEWTTATNIQGLAATGTGSAVRATSPSFTTNIKLANSATPSTPAVADTAYDTNAWAAGRGAIQVHDGTATTYVVATLSSDVPSNGDVPTWGTGGSVTWEPSGSGATAVTAASTFGTDNVLLKSDGTSRGSQATGITIADTTNDMTGVGNLTVGNLTTTDLTITGSITGVMGVVNGGTGRATGTTAYSLLATGTTATGAQQTLANGATTEILVGAGAAALPVWTTATGTGAPVRAGSPTFTGNVTLASGASPTTTVAGDTAFDTNAQGAGRGSIQVFDGTANTYVAAALASDTPTNGQVLTWNTGGTMTWETPSGGSQFLPWYDVVGTYNGSGSATTTTGDINATSPTLTVASGSTFVINQGILIKGAGTAGAHHVSTITNVVGTTITIANNAITTVVGAVVQHDDTAAINAALAAAYNAIGGRVLLRPGTYRCNAPLNVTTNSILTLPQDLTYVGAPKRLELIGDVRSSSSGGGVSIDCTDAPTGTGTRPAVFAGAPDDDDTFTNWQNVDMFIDGVTITVVANPTLSGINFSNCLRGSLGDSILIGTANVLTEPTNTSYGVIFPREHNNIVFYCGKAQIIGFNTGILAYEHLELRGPTIAFSITGMEVSNPLAYSLHLINGSLCIENCSTMIRKTGTGNQAVSLILQAEVYFAGSGGTAWINGIPGQDVVDSSANMWGEIRYACINNSTGAALSLGVTGGTNVSFTNLYAAPSTPGVPPTADHQYDLENLNDSVGSLHLTGFNSPTFDVGKVLNGMVLNGTDQYGSNSTLSVMGGDFTIFGWFKKTNAATVGEVFSQYNFARQNIQVFVITNTVNFGIRDAAGGFHLVTSPTPIVDNTWYFVVAQRNGTTMQIKVDNAGAWISTTSVGDYDDSSGIIPPFRVGADGSADAANNPNNFFGGTIDQIKVFTSVVSDADLTLLYDADLAIGSAVVSNTAYGTSWDSVTDVAPSKNAVFDAFGTQINYPLTVYGAGTAYALTNTAAAIDFGTTDPTKVIDKAGTYMIFGQVHVSYNGATVTAETMTLKVRRTNNTAADVSAVLVIDLPGSSIVTNSYGTVTIPPFVYTSANADDSLSIFANVSATLAAGTVEATAIGTSLVALKIY